MKITKDMLARHNQTMYDFKAQPDGDEQEVDDHILFHVGGDILHV